MLIKTIHELSNDALDNCDLEELIRLNTGLIGIVAKKYYRHEDAFFSLEDCYSIAVIGFIKASKNYKKDKGTNFATYAMLRMNGELKDYFRQQYIRVQNNNVKISVPKPHYNALSIDSSAQGVYTDRVAMIQDSSPCPELLYDYKEYYKTVAEYIKMLPERTQYIIIQHTYNNKSFRAIAKELNITETRACYIQRQALKIIRAQLEAMGYDHDF